jgi:hypothetical protein
LEPGNRQPDFEIQATGKHADNARKAYMGDQQRFVTMRQYKTLRDEKARRTVSDCATLDPTEPQSG